MRVVSNPFYYFFPPFLLLTQNNQHITIGELGFHKRILPQKAANKKIYYGMITVKNLIKTVLLQIPLDNYIILSVREKDVTSINQLDK